MDALKQMSISNSVTLRDGFESEIPTTELVPGDIVKLEEGINVPADIRLLEVYQCRVDESALTGESEPITKHLEPMDVNTLLEEGLSRKHQNVSQFKPKKRPKQRNFFNNPRMK